MSEETPTSSNATAPPNNKADEAPQAKKRKVRDPAEVYDPLSACYSGEGHLECSFTLDALKKEPQESEKVQLGNHLKWYLMVSIEPSTDDPSEKELCAFVKSRDLIYYPISFDATFTMGSPDESHSQTISLTYHYFDTTMHDNGVIFYELERFKRDRHLFEGADGKIKITLDVEIRIPTCFNFKSISTLADTKIKVGSAVFPLNRMCLAYQSPVFYAMLFGSFDETTQEVVTLEDVDEIAFATLLNALFVCSFDLKAKSVPAVLPLADRFGLAAVSEKCEMVLTDGRDRGEIDIGQKYLLATRYSLKSLEDYVMKRALASAQTYRTLTTSEYFAEASPEAKLAVYEKLWDVIPPHLLALTR